MAYSSKVLKPEIVVRSLTREGLLTNTWNKLVKGYEYKDGNSGWYLEGKYWCTKMTLKKTNP